jgi:endonuclease/exonuclease/phosphatase (EEP) superfamily protein YafD
MTGKTKAWRRWLDPVLLPVAALAIAVSLIPLAAEHWWGFELFAHFRLQYLAIQAAVLLPLAALRRPRWCVAVVLAMMLNAAPIAPYLPRAIEASVSAGHGINVMAVNVSKRGVGAERLLEIIEIESPDLVLLVEYTPSWGRQLHAIRDAYPHQLTIPRDDAFGLALLSRHPFERAESVDLESTAAIDARVRTPGGTFRMLGVHLRPPTTRAWAAERNRQLDALAALRAATPEPLLIAGDFNVSPFSPFFSSWLARTDLRNTAAGHGPTYTWPTFLPLLGIPIDHCVVSEQFVVIAHRRLPAFGSDHYPIFARLMLDASHD